MKTAIVYFSATGNTKKMAEILKSEFNKLGVKTDLYDVTSESERNVNERLSGYDALMFGFPVHSLRAPRIMREWLSTIEGCGRKCGMFFTYGGFTVDPSHYTTAEILKGQGFVVVSSAEFPGKHTYNLGGWKAFIDRPDNREFELAGKYAEAIYKKFTGEDETVIGELDKGDFSEEQLDQFEMFRFKVLTKLPTRDGVDCCMCAQCATVCPAGAMDSVSGEVDPDKCIGCLGCVAICPENALHINSMAKTWELKLKMSKITETELNSMTGKIFL